MNPLKASLGLIALAAIGAAAFYAYSNFSKETTSLPTQTATISDSVQPDSLTGEKVAASPSSTESTEQKPTLEGFKEKELKEGLDNIKAGLDLLQNPFE